MEHVVFFSESSGDAAFRRVADLEEAVRLVESLRNERGITDVAVHALTPVPVSFRTYYRVEVAVDAPVAPAPVTESAEPVAAAEPVPSAEPSFEVPAVEPSLEAEPESIEAPALHLLPPPAVEVAVEPEQVEVVEDDRDEVEAVDAELEQAVEDAVAESVEQAESDEQIEDEQGDSFAAFSLELVREDEVVADFQASQFDGAEFDGADFDGAEEPVAELTSEPASEQASESAEEFAAFGSYEALVPQVRPEPEVEHSLGYFAR